jgi:hypothetical protein
MPPSGWGASGLLTYQFNVTTPGQYVVRLHCYGEQDMYRSVFFKMDNDQSFATADHNGWVEYFVNAVNQWSWDTRIVAYNGATWNDVAPVVTLGAGLHTSSFPAGSSFCMDRIAIFLESIPEATAGIQPARPPRWANNPHPGRAARAAGAARTQKIGTNADPCGCGSIAAAPSLRLPLIASFLGLAALWICRRGR